MRLLLVIAVGWYAYALRSQPEPASVSFDGQRAYADVQTQVALGPRSPGRTDGHAQIVEWMRAELESADWEVEVQESEALGHPIQNIVAKRGDASPQIILGAHYKLAHVRR